MKRIPEFDMFSREYNFWAGTCRKARYSKVINFLPENTNRALDAGCGPGILAIEMLEKAKKVIGVDISNNMLKVAKSNITLEQKSGIQFLQADLKNLPLKEMGFDFIACFGALHHLDINLTLDTFKKIINPNGRIVIVDYTTSQLHQHTSSIWQIRRALKCAPKYMTTYGFSATLRILRFRMSKKWLNHVCKDKLLTPDSYQDILSSKFPNSIIKFLDGAIIAYWQAT